VPPTRKNAGKMPALQKTNASRGREAQYATGLLYHEGKAGQAKKSGVVLRDASKDLVRERREKADSSLRSE
jgi:hypothetical protein